MRDQIAHVAPAVDLAQLRARWAALDAREEKTLAEIRLERGRVLVDARKAFPTSGRLAAGWGELLAVWKIEERTAQRYMQLAGYVAAEIPDKVSAIPTYAKAGIVKQALKLEPRPPARETRRVIVDHSQDAAGSGDEPAWQEPTFIPDGEAPAPTAKPCRLCGTVPGGRSTKLASTCKNGCGRADGYQPKSAAGAEIMAVGNRGGNGLPAMPATGEEKTPARQLSFDWSSTAAAVSRDVVAAGPAAALAMVLDIMDRVPGVQEALAAKLSGGRA